MADKIPTKLKVFLRKEIEVADPRGTKHKVRPAFVTDADCSESAQDTAERWCQGRSSGPAESFEVQNHTIRDVVIVELVVRGEGGRAWKVIWHTFPLEQDGKEFKDIDPIPCLVDLREDVFVDALFNTLEFKHPIQYGKLHLTGQWIRHGSQMRITTIGSEMYMQADEDMRQKAKPRIKLKDLIVGGVYPDAKRQFLNIYMGRVRYNGKFHCAWFPLWWRERTDYQEWYDSEHRLGRYEITLTTNSSAKEQVGKVTLSKTHIPWKVINGHYERLDPALLEGAPWAVAPNTPVKWEDDPFNNR